MQLLNLLLTTLLATSVTAKSSFFGSSSHVAPYEESFDVPGENPLQHCEDPKDDILNLTSVDLDPNPPKKGENLTITAKGTLSEEVTKGAQVHLQVKYGLITIIKETTGLCNAVKNVDKECPLEKGNITLDYDIQLPKQIPPGKYTVLADVYTKDEDKITCLKATVEFGKSGSMFKQGL